MAQQYSATTAANALAAATAETLLTIVAPANRIFEVIEFGVSFDGVTASAVPVKVDLCTFDVTTAGTSGTTLTSVQEKGPIGTTAMVAKSNYSAEPTNLVIIKSWNITPCGGVLVIQQPLGREPECIVAKGLALRATAPAAVNDYAYFTWVE